MPRPKTETRFRDALATLPLDVCFILLAMHGQATNKVGCIKIPKDCYLGDSYWTASCDGSTIYLREQVDYTKVKNAEAAIERGKVQLGELLQKKKWLKRAVDAEEQQENLAKSRGQQHTSPTKARTQKELEDAEGQIPLVELAIKDNEQVAADAVVNSWAFPLAEIE